MQAFIPPTPLAPFSHSLSSTPLLKRPPPPEPPFPKALTRLTAKLPDVLIIGAGISALSTAYELSHHGASVHLYHAPQTTHPPAAFAAAGMLAPNAEPIAEPLQTMAHMSRAMYPQFISRISSFSSIDVGYVSRDDFLVPYLAGEDIADGSLTGAQARFIEPALGETVIAAKRIMGDAQVNNRQLMCALREACLRMGVQIKMGMVRNLVSAVDTGELEGVFVEGEGVVSAGHYILAAGAWSRRLLPTLPVRPVKGQLLSLKPSGDEFGELRHALCGREVYIVPKNEGKEYFVGATVEEGTFDLTNTAGGVSKLLNGAIKLVPSFGEYEIKETWSGLRPAMPDLMPVFGLAEYSNLSIATGYYRNGILLAPIAGKIAAATAMGETDRLPAELREMLPAFSIDRFLGIGSGFSTLGAETQKGDPTSADESNAAQGNYYGGAAEPDIALETYQGSTEGAVEPLGLYQGGDVEPIPISSQHRASGKSEASSPRPAQAQIYRVLRDGSQEAVEPSEQFLAKIKASSQIRTVKPDEIRASEVPSPETQDQSSQDSIGESIPTGTPELSSEFNFAEYQKNVANPETVSGENDAYEDVTQHRGENEEEIMRKAMERNRSFGRKQSALERECGTVLSLTDEEVAAFDKALNQGVQDMDEAAESFSPNHQSVIASQIDKEALVPSQSSNTDGINGVSMADGIDRAIARGDSQSEGYF